MDDNWGVQSHGLEIPIEVYQKSSSELENSPNKVHPKSRNRVVHQVQALDMLTGACFQRPGVTKNR
jgi:hypothetical protein